MEISLLINGNESPGAAYFEEIKFVSRCSYSFKIRDDTENARKFPMGNVHHQHYEVMDGSVEQHMLLCRRESLATIHVNR